MSSQRSIHQDPSGIHDGLAESRALVKDPDLNDALLRTPTYKFEITKNGLTEMYPAAEEVKDFNRAVLTSYSAGTIESKQRGIWYWFVRCVKLKLIC